jgi:hypothetical protein
MMGGGSFGARNKRRKCQLARPSLSTSIDEQYTFGAVDRFREVGGELKTSNNLDRRRMEARREFFGCMPT